jgi:sirohydrochlorin cobaltochelatase
MKRGILLVGFGVSHPEARRKIIDHLIEEVARRFPDFDVRIAFTSRGAINKIMKLEGLEIPDVENALSAMHDEQVRTVAVQPLHLLNGLEFHKIVQCVWSMREKDTFDEIVIGRPLLSSPGDYLALIDALKTQFPRPTAGHAVVLMGHGTSHPSDAAYSRLQLMMDEQGLEGFIGTLEGYPGLEQVRGKLRKSGVREVTLMPLLLSSGDHVTEDMAGSGEDSWKSVLERDGFRVKLYMRGLGENEQVQSLYIRHIEDILRELKA